MILSNKAILLSIICLLGVGFLVGNSFNLSGHETSFWSAFGAIGAWVGGIGAITAAFVAVHIAKIQLTRDTHKIVVKKKLMYPKDVVFTAADLEVNDDDLKPESAILHLEIANIGLRPIQLTMVNIRYKGFKFGIRLDHNSLLEPGCLKTIEFPNDNEAFKALQLVDSTVGNRAAYHCFNSEISVSDALGIKHLATDKNDTQ